MRVLITGGAGYLGTIVAQQFLLRGYHVCVLDNFRHGQPSLTSLCAFDRLEIVRGNAQDTEALLPLMRRADVLIPLAALVGAPLCAANVSEAWETNCRAVIAMKNNASADQLIIYPNTNSGYGKASEGMCTEQSPLEPVSEYGRSKVKAEEFVLRHPLAVAFRFATLFGCSYRMRLDLMVNEFVYRAVRDKALSLFEPGFRRNFLHVRDAAGAIVFAVENHARMSGLVFNAGHPEANLTKEQLCTEIGRFVPGFTFRVREGERDPDQRDYLVSNERLLATGWKPNYSLQDGIVELVRCFSQPFEGHRNA